MRKRTRAREIALQMLYQLDAQGSDAEQQIEEFLAKNCEADGEMAAFARELVLGTRGALEEIDALLTAAAENWKLRRMALVDRNILRMAIWELLHAEEIPAKVTINEAIEMGKRFSTQQSGAFINGILDRIRKEQGL